MKSYDVLLIVNTEKTKITFFIRKGLSTNLVVRLNLQSYLSLETGKVIIVRMLIAHVRRGDYLQHAQSVIPCHVDKDVFTAYVLSNGKFYEQSSNTTNAIYMYNIYFI